MPAGANAQVRTPPSRRMMRRGRPIMDTLPRPLLTRAAARQKIRNGIVDRNVRNGSTAPHRGVRAPVGSDAEDSPLWRELPRAAPGRRILQPCHMPRSLCAPYVLPRWPKSVDRMARARSRARHAVRSGPSGSAHAFANLGYVIIGVADWEVADSDPKSNRSG